jgi:hypothetical protein
MTELFWPARHLGEVEAGIDPYTEIVSYAHPPGRRERYTESGWNKAVNSGLFTLDVRDFGAVGDSTGNQPKEGQA